MSQKITLEISGRTDVGMEREHNEDNFLVGDLTARSRAFADGAMQVGPHGVLLAVCDGMGGAAAGEIASELAVTVVYDEILGQEGRPTTRDDIAMRLERAAQLATTRIYSDALSNPAWQGMGTTLTAAALVDDHVVFAQVGDSRAYVLRDGKLTQLTRDQSLVAKLVELGVLDAEQAATFEHSNIILQALGAAPDVIVEMSQFRAKRGDRLLLCSDGLSGMVSDAEIQSMLFGATDPSTLCIDLIERAKEYGGYDNITAVVAFFDGEGVTDAPLPVLVERYGGGDLLGIPDPRGLGEHMRPRIRNGVLVDAAAEPEPEPVELTPLEETPSPDTVVDPGVIGEATAPMPVLSLSLTPTPPPPELEPQRLTQPIATPAPTPAPGGALMGAPPTVRAPSALRATLTSITFPLPPAPAPVAAPPASPSSGSIAALAPDSARDASEGGYPGEPLPYYVGVPSYAPPPPSSPSRAWLVAVILVSLAIIAGAIVFVSTELRRPSTPAATGTERPDIAPTTAPTPSSQWVPVAAPEPTDVPTNVTATAANGVRPRPAATTKAAPKATADAGRGPAKPAVQSSGSHDLAPIRDDE